MEYGAATDYLVHHVGRARTDTVGIRLTVPRPIPRGTLALTNVRILTMDDARQVIENGTVLVTGSRIACVGSCDASRADRVVAASGAETVAPGIGRTL